LPVDAAVAVADPLPNHRSARVVETVYELVMASPVGWLGVRTDGSALTAVEILAGPAPAGGRPGAAAQQVGEALGRYFAGDTDALAGLPVAPTGTPFQRRVWERLRTVRPGEISTYGALGRGLGTSARAVGGACRANPIPLVIPCHRVVGAAGLGGYSGERAGDGVEKKRWLLAHEGARL
jgi:methylated-DNA-[protein]-cysteine S-methyltransferase